MEGTTMRLSTTTLARGSAKKPWLTIGIWVLALLEGAGAIIALVLPGGLTAQYSFIGRPDSQVGRNCWRSGWACRRRLTKWSSWLVGASAEDPAFRAESWACRGG